MMFATRVILGLVLSSTAFSAASSTAATASATAPAGSSRWPAQPNPDAPVRACPKLDGYHGIWYANQATHDEYQYKYSGGLGTYPSNHLPIAYYAEKVNKTFFVYGGMPEDGAASAAKRTLLICVSYYDHKTGTVPRPTLLMDKKTDDAHDNATIMLDDKGYVWVFVASHGTSRPAYVFKSGKPYEIDAFQQIWETNFSYPEPWYVEGKGFLFLHTRYDEGKRNLYQMTSPDGLTWSKPRLLAAIARGQYQISGRYKNKIAMAFNEHPVQGGLNARTNLYYMETTDFGQTWQTMRREKIELPLTSIANKALVHDYASDGLLVYLQDLNFDPRGNPVILYLTSRGWEPGPKHNWRKFNTARWGNNEWELTGLLLADNNYDTGCLHLEEGHRWRLIAPTIVGRDLPPEAPQPYNPGGEILMWTSDNMGRTWKSHWLTNHSTYNHGYVRRPVNASPDFYAFWADGDGRRPSESRLYFADKEGHVFRLPARMSTDLAKPEPLPFVAASRPSGR